MSQLEEREKIAEELARKLREYLAACYASNGSAEPFKPSNRVKFLWPPHPVSYSYHVLASDWKGEARFEAYGETFEVVVARTPHGVFGRCDRIWHEARGETEEEMLRALRESAEPLFQRQLRIHAAMGREGRFEGHIRELPPEDLLKLLYCEDRDVANDARIEIEAHASLKIFRPALIEVLRDRTHPHRRSAQWCVLDLFEDLPGFSDGEAQEREAIGAIRDLIWDASDDYARTIYKAGVVLGGYLPHSYGGEVLLECLAAPSKIGRRSAIHGLFHVVEWVPERKEEVVEALRRHAASETVPALKEFATLMARDIESGNVDHIPEPLFAGEA